MKLEMYDHRGRLIGETSELSITVNDLMFDPSSEVPMELSFVLKFSGFMKEWPAKIFADGKEYIFNGQNAISREWAETYCGAASYARV